MKTLIWILRTGKFHKIKLVIPKIKISKFQSTEEKKIATNTIAEII